MKFILYIMNLSDYMKAKIILSFIISFFIMTLLACFILGSKEGFFLPEYVFWILFVPLVSIITYQILTLDFNSSKNKYALLIIIEILLLSFLIRLIFYSPSENVLFGYDGYNELFSMLQIKDNNWNPFLVEGYPSAYPLFYIYASIWSQITLLNLSNTVKMIPYALYFLAPIMVYLIGKLRYSTRTGLLALFGISLLYMSVLFHSIFHREVLAFPLMLIVLYLYFKLLKSKDMHITFSILIISLSGVVVLIHHLTSFIMLVFFVIMFIVELFTSHVRKHQKLADFIKMERTSLTLVLLLFTLIFGYWVYLQYTPLKLIAQILEESHITESGRSIVTYGLLRLKLIFWGEIIFAGIFTVLSALGLISLFLLKKIKSNDIAIFIFSIFMGVLMFVTVSGRLIPSEALGLGSRFEVFVYIGLILLSGCFSSFLIKYGSNNLLDAFRNFSTRLTSFLMKLRVNTFLGVLKKAIPIIFILFILLNMYRIPPYLYSDHELSADDSRLMITQQEIFAAFWLGLGRGDVISDRSVNGALSLSQYYRSINASYGVINRKKYSYVLDTKVFESKIKGNITSDSNLIYGNGLSEIFLVNK